jgi:hypothetical protein
MKRPRHEQHERLLEDFQKAKDFVSRSHPREMRWIHQRCKSLVKSFEEFFEEYVYVIVASGFRAAVAARLTELLLKCKGSRSKMLKVFKNEAKVNALAVVYRTYREDDAWKTFRKSLKTEDSLLALPRIGPAVKFHLARNIGLCPNAVKPDVHLVRYAQEYEYDSVASLVDVIQRSHGTLAAGEIDFILWVWLSHDRGLKALPCCGNLGYRIR